MWPTVFASVIKGSFFYENVKCVLFAKVSLINDFTDLPHRDTFKRRGFPIGFGARFSKVPKTFKARKAIRETETR